MRNYLCLDCNCTWQIIFGEEKRGVKQACPNCKSLNVQRVQNGRAWFWRSPGNRRVKINPAREERKSSG